MSKLFQLILSISISGSILILLLLAIRPLVKKYFSKSWQYYIWIVVLIRLLVPFSPDFGLLNRMPYQLQYSFLNQNVSMPDSYATASTEQDSADVALINTSTESVAETDKSVLNYSEDLPANKAFSVEKGDYSKPDNWTIAAIIWIIGILFLLLIKVIQYARFLYLVHKNSEPVADKNLIMIFQATTEKLQIKRRPQLYYCDKIQSPMLIGIIKPTVFLTDITLNLDEKSISYVFCHELVHYKRYDFFYKWLCELVRILHWFNPFLYLMIHLINKQCELSCDEAIVKDLEKEEKCAYGNVLLTAVAEHNRHQKSILSIPLYENKNTLKERLKYIMQAKGQSKRIKGISLITAINLSAMVILLGACPVNAKVPINANIPVKADVSMTTKVPVNTKVTVNAKGSMNETDNKTGAFSTDNKADNTSDSSFNVGNTFYKKDDSYTLPDCYQSKLKISTNLGDITVQYHDKKTAEISAEYEINESLLNYKEVLDLAEIKTYSKDNTLIVKVVKKGTNQEFWDYMNQRYKNKVYDLSIGIKIKVPNTVNNFDLETAMGEINLYSLSGEVRAKTALGDIHASNMNFKNSTLSTDLGDVICSLNKKISDKSKVTLTTALGNIQINANSLPFSKRNSGDDFLAESYKVIINKVCEIKAETYLGEIKIMK